MLILLCFGFVPLRLSRRRIVSYSEQKRFQGVSRICLFTIDLQFCYLCIRMARVYKLLRANIHLTTSTSGTGEHIRTFTDLNAK